MKNPKSTNLFLIRRRKVGFKDRLEKIPTETRNVLLAALNVWHAKNGFSNVTHGFERDPSRVTEPVHIE